MKNYFQMLLDEANALTPDQVVAVSNPTGDHRLILVCEHACNWLPPRFGDLGLDAAARHSHAAWDPGALGVAEALSRILDAPLLFGRVSRLVYDCNRPPTAADAVPPVSEVFPVPGNARLSEEAREERVRAVYQPFRRRLENVLAAAPPDATLVTVHSFTPVYHGRRRRVEIGVLHGEDPSLARIMIERTRHHTDRTVRLNEPYGPQDGVTHTLDLHGTRNGLPNVMLEIRNDLIATPGDQAAMAEMLGGWLETAIAGHRASREDRR